MRSSQFMAVLPCAALLLLGNVPQAQAQEFTISKGRIMTPAGARFLAKGINIADWAAVAPPSESGSDNGEGVLTLFHGINMVRLNMQGTKPLAQYSGNTAVSAVAAFITALTNAKIVVIVDNHSSVPGADNCLTGPRLTNETTWFVSFATAYANNPYVWFSTLNEPNDTASEEVCVAEQIATYDAIRKAGNNNPVVMQMIQGYSVTVNGGIPLNSYAGLHNVLWDTHYYGWISNYSTNYNTVESDLTNQVASGQKYMSADGAMPVIIGEYGNSTSGNTPDANGTEVITAVQASGFGALAWTWQAGAADWLVQDGTTLTSYGQEVATFIAN